MRKTKASATRSRGHGDALVVSQRCLNGGPTVRLLKPAVPVFSLVHIDSATQGCILYNGKIDAEKFELTVSRPMLAEK